jgi:hypothetical protein
MSLPLSVSSQVSELYEEPQSTTVTALSLLKIELQFILKITEPGVLAVVDAEYFPDWSNINESPTFVQGRIPILTCRLHTSEGKLLEIEPVTSCPKQGFSGFIDKIILGKV